MISPLFVRPSATLRAAVDASGAPGAATKALLLLGLAATGRDMRDLEREIRAALASDLAPDLSAAIHQLFVGLGDASTVLADCYQGASTVLAPTPLDDPPDPLDPFTGVGFEV